MIGTRLYPKLPGENQYMIRSNGRMTLTFNLDRYKDLLCEYQPKLIKTEQENEEALMMIEKLMHLPERTPEQDELYELLIVLIEKFEQCFYQPSQENNPLSMLLFLMDQRDMQLSELVDFFGSQSAVDDIFSGKTLIDQSSAESLSKIFHVDINFFF
jgi:HTH-type transcriptional regulator / antitoxin HigA